MQLGFSPVLQQGHLSGGRNLQKLNPIGTFRCSAVHCSSCSPIHRVIKAVPNSMFGCNSQASAAQTRRASHVMASSSGALAGEILEFANKLADAAAEVTTRYFRSDLFVESKGDLSPVTIADRETEEAMRRLIKDRFPDHGIFGEEAGMEAGSSSAYLWVLDPIDGTKSFITGKPLWGTLISLLINGEPVLGIIDQPVLKERWVGVKGMQTTLNGKPISVRKCGDINAGYLYATTPHMFVDEWETSFGRVRDAVRIPMYGCDCYAYGLLAAGFCDLVVEADLKPYDYMALVPIVEGAGGIITGWQGEHLKVNVTGSGFFSLQSLPGEIVAAGDPVVHKQAIDLLAWQGVGISEDSPVTYGS